MKFAIIIFGIILITLKFFVFSDYGGQIYSTPTPIPTPKPITPEEIRLEVSDYRKQQDLPELKVSPELCDFAQQRADEIFKNNDWSHNGFYKVTYPPSYQWVGENLAKDFHTKEAVLQAWLNSPEHKKNLDDQRWADTCVRIEGNIIVMIYGQPKLSQPVKQRDPGDVMLLQGVFDN